MTVSLQERHGLCIESSHDGSQRGIGHAVYSGILYGYRKA